MGDGSLVVRTTAHLFQIGEKRLFDQRLRITIERTANPSERRFLTSHI
jgi:hypothetical protein